MHALIAKALLSFPSGTYLRYCCLIYSTIFQFRSTNCLSFGTNVVCPLLALLGFRFLRSTGPRNALKNRKQDRKCRKLALSAKLADL